ncbi:MAG: hypothetical protein Q7S43_05175 [bacterium]|nr:hypothetical protein [bacterium]
MENKKVLEIVDKYKQYFQEEVIPNIKYPHDKAVLFGNVDDILAHCHSMLNGVGEFISLGDKEKRDRALIRLGFIQCGLWATGHYTVEDLKDHNRPDVETISEQTNQPLTKEDLEDWEY